VLYAYAFAPSSGGLQTARAALSIIFETRRSKRSWELNVTPKTVRDSTLVKYVASEEEGVCRVIIIFWLLV